ncbi:MAG: beta-ketoacyl-ACP synthase II [Thermodesulfobacteria bacterium]|nr:beta-ketoacyl-ACP synthase II [Thermodesulfobacteriota bacterium]
MRRRVVVTGLGAITPVGLGVEESWQNVVAGRSGIGPITKFDASGYSSRVAGEVKGFNPEDYMPKKLIPRVDAFIQYAIAATREALEDARLGEGLGERAGVIIGVGMGGTGVVEKYTPVLRERGWRRVTPFFIPMIIPNMASGQVAILFGAKGPNTAVCTACAAGTHALGESFRLIRDGYADIMIAGGTESLITPLTVAGFAVMKALSTKFNDTPEKASRPFDAKRDGFVIAEGSGVLILEELEHARARGAKIYAEIVGYGLNGDAYHMTAPTPDGEGPARCMELALKDAGISPEEVDYINAHGTSTPLNDAAETKAIKRVFGPKAKELAISSTKSMTGHLLGGAGGVEGVFTVKTITEGVIPPTINYEEPDPECDLDYVPNVARKARVRVAMSNSFGFGGTNAVIIFKAFEEEA